MTLTTADSLDGNAAVATNGRATAAATAPARSIVVYGMNYTPELVGVGKYTGEIARHLSDEGWNVTVVTTPPHYPAWQVSKGYRNSYSRTEDNGIRVFRTPLILRDRMQGIWRLLAPLSFAVTSAPIAVWQILRRRPQIVFCIEPTLLAAPVAIVAARLVGAKVILHVQDLEVDAAFAVGHLRERHWVRRLAETFEKMTMAGVDQLVTISEHMRTRLLARGVAPAKLSLVRNWVDLEEIYPLERTSTYRSQLGFDAGDFVVLYAGTLGAKQGLHGLIDAAARLRDDAHIHFVLVGEGPLRNELEARAGELPNVRFMPFQPRSRLNELMNMPDLHILPQEKVVADMGLPSKLNAMVASGRPILVTADAGTELAGLLMGSAYIVPPDDPAQLAEAILAASRKQADFSGSQAGLAQSLSKITAMKALAEVFRA
ncbi:WcaI family glycosyltransferase [Rhizobium sp. NTR19]|uniref:WcaI family glycosyltransferase n=1 Tax=Neorhizobium turbinariae TaxID=2937795 RepID=A0ABT0IUG1_9HYPH|nr:WcaI family glycosyltransferase [Neorhizobium turbinariae]MCK8781508.1 WcaI family glycosyltransferase [Neorhizobium turbinariae]